MTANVLCCRPTEQGRSCRLWRAIARSAGFVWFSGPAGASETHRLEDTHGDPYDFPRTVRPARQAERELGRALRRTVEPRPQPVTPAVAGPGGARAVVGDRPRHRRDAASYGKWCPRAGPGTPQGRGGPAAPRARDRRRGA